MNTSRLCVATVSLCIAASHLADAQSGTADKAKRGAGATTRPDVATLKTLKTVAEQSEFRSTARYDDVRAFLRALAAASPLVRLSDIGTSGEGRAIPLAIIADPPVASAQEAKKSGKLIVAMTGGIHSGECDGKEGLLALARDIVLQRHASKSEKAAGTAAPQPLDAINLDHAVLLFIPIYNPDGNEKMAPDNRPGQAGPETMGRRENHAGLDLNRDFVKLEAPETRGLVKLFNEYDPAVFIDTHTTNGSFHRYLLTYDTSKNPAGDAALLAFARGTMLPRISQTVKKKHGFDTFWYGNFRREHSEWETYPDEPRYGVNYVGMRNRIAILTESYSYAPYKERVDAQYKFVAACIDDAVEHRDEIRKLIKDADRRATGSDETGGGGGERWRAGARRSIRVSEEHEAATQPAEDAKPKKDEPITVVTGSKLVASEAKHTIPGFVEERRNGRSYPLDEYKDYEVELFVTYAADATVVRPYAYVLASPAEGAAPSPDLVKVRETLQRHGIKVDELREDIELDLAAYTIRSVKRASRPFQGHTTATVEAESKPVSRRIAAGSLLVRTGQPLGTLAAYLLEPASADGLATWNFFDESIHAGDEFAVLRLEKPVPLTMLPAVDLPEDRKPRQPITYELVNESDHAPDLSGSPVSIGAWLDDSHFLQTKNGRLYKVDAATGRAERVYDPAPIAAALAQLPTISKSEAEAIANHAEFGWDKQRTGFVFEHKGDLYYCGMNGTGACRLTASPRGEELWSLSPDGRFVAFVRDNDLWVVDVATHTERALTTGGSDTLRRGKADWVYHEEIFGRRQSTFWWSPDSRRIAYLEIDSSPVKVYTIVNDVPEGLAVEGTRYPKVGQPNPTVKVFVVHAAGGAPSEIDLGEYSPQDMLVLNVGWRADSSGFITYVSNRFQTWADVLACPADGGQPTRLFRETTKAWIDSPAPPRFFKDGSFLFQSERSGWQHFYLYAKDGKLIGPVTGGEWEARSIVELDEEHDRLYVSGTGDGGMGSCLYSVSVGKESASSAPAAKTCLTTAPRSHHTSVSPNGTYFVDSWSDSTHPTRVGVFLTKNRSLVRMLDTNPVRDLDRYILGEYERVHIPAADGAVIEGSILRPASFDATRRYPVWFMTYGGPHAPSVGDGWSRRSYDELLCSAGFVVFRADPRSASGKGAQSAWTAYKQLGVGELADIEAAIKWLCKYAWVDANRIGMAGHSYGGFMTAYCMTHSTLFAAGIAGAPVTDWRDYDSIYTERYMLTPAENPEGYDKTSVVKAAKNLHGKLLLLHGMIDDNVHVQNSSRFIRALRNADKQFEMMFYPEARHGVGGKHYNRLTYDFIVRTLGGPASAPAPTAPIDAPAVTGP